MDRDNSLVPNPDQAAHTEGASPATSPSSSSSMMGNLADRVGGSFLQRKIQRRALQRKKTPGAPDTAANADEQKAGKTAATNDPVAKLHFLVDVDVKDLGLADLKNGNVGHTWVSLEYSDPATVPPTVDATHRPLLEKGGRYSDPMGFWPKIWVDDQGQRHGGYSTNIFKSYVDGEMRHPDRAHQGAEKATQSWDLTQAEVDRVIGYAESKRNAKYSVYWYNCTTFGKEAVEAAGKTAPSSSKGGICFPNAAYKGIKKNQDKGVGHTEVKDLDSEQVNVVDAPDAHGKKK